MSHGGEGLVSKQEMEYESRASVTSSGACKDMVIESDYMRVTFCTSYSIDGVVLWKIHSV